MDYKKELISKINRIAGRYSAYEVYTDWIRCMALSISNSCQLIHNKVWQDREQMYLDTIRKYTPEEQKLLSSMLELLALALEEQMEDVLGDIYMKSGMGSSAAGQFFTPYHLSRACAELVTYEFDEKGKITINEPSCGGGGMIIGAADVIKQRGHDYQQVMEVVAQDLDWKGVYMTYVQLSLLGISAICVQGDTLARPFIPGETDDSHILYTPRKAGLIV